MASAVRIVATFALLTTCLTGTAWATPFSVLSLTGADKINASGNQGQGIVFGDLDTGVIANWAGFTPALTGNTYSSINTANSAVCLNGTCTKGISLSPIGNPETDHDGHGTFTASQIVGKVPSSANGVNYSNYGYASYAPKGTLVSVQVLGSDGSGSSNDLVNGINYAVNVAKVNVINMSLAPSSSGSLASQQKQQSEFYQGLAPAINAGAAKGVYFVFAAGNNSQPFSDGAANITGFTAVALQHMLIMGSTNARKNLSYFSDTAGTGYFSYSDGKTIKKAPITSMMLFSDGENNFGASNCSTPSGCSTGAYGYNYLTQDSGTSMSAPQGTGAIGLLLAQWPKLALYGTAAQILLTTGDGIGPSTTFGEGFMNLVKAFKPIGDLKVTGANGQSVTVSATGAVLTTGALGNIASVKAILTNYTAFDTWQRNFTVNLASSVANKAPTSQAAVTVTAPAFTTTASHFDDGSSLTFGSSDTHPHLMNASQTPSDKHWFMSFTDAAGTTMASGSGVPVSSSFANALWGMDSAAAGASSMLGVSDTLLDLAEGGTFVAVGNQLSADTRMAVSWTETAQKNANGTSLTQPNANAFSTGITTNVMEGWKAGLTLGLLNEQDGLLGTTYTSNGILGFGDHNQSTSMGLSSDFSLTDTLDLLVDGAIVRTNGNGITSGIISDITPLYARTMGAALINRDNFTPHDNLSISVRAPLRIMSGSASVATTSVDRNGDATINNQRVSLIPNGNELDFSIGYAAPITHNMSWNLSVDARRDAGNVAGSNDADFLVGAKLSF